MLRALADRFDGWIYFIRAAVPKSPIKIGYSTEPDVRLSTLQQASPSDLYIAALMPGDPPTERRLHERFASGRLRGEWFRHDTPGLADLIAAALHLEGFPWDLDAPVARPVLDALDFEPPRAKDPADVFIRLARRRQEAA